MSKPTGRSRGRPRKGVSVIKTHLELASQKLIEAGESGALFGLTEEQIQKLLPLDVFRLTMQHAVRLGDLKLAREVAKDWAPYEHERKNSARALTFEEFVNAVNVAKAEAARRGIDIGITSGYATGSLAN